MTFVPSMRDIPISQEPHKSVLEALMPDPLAEEYAPVDLSEASNYQRKHLNQCAVCADLLGLNGVQAGEL
jgi:hypothetical protein